MTLLKLSSLLCNISEHHLRRLQVRNFHINDKLLFKRVVTYEAELPQTDHDEFGKITTIYKFPYMTHAQFFYNAKYYLGLVYVPAWITEGIAYSFGDLSSEELVLLNVLKTVFLAKCLLINKWLTHLIGFMYITEDDHLVIAHVNFRGRRIDEKFAMNELVLETNKVKILDKLYVNLRCKATGRKFKLNLKLCEMDEMAVVNFFGSLPNSAF